jgi:hypothetical protein
MSASTEPKGARTALDDAAQLEHGRERAEDRGYRTLAPVLPGMEVEVEAPNADRCCSSLGGGSPWNACVRGSRLP